MTSKTTIGNIVVCGERVETALHRTRASIRVVEGSVQPHHTDAQTRAIVIVESDATSVAECARAMRCWAHEALLPIVALLPSPPDAEHPLPWGSAFTCATMGNAEDIVRLLDELEHERSGLPSIDDADHTWSLRHRIRQGPFDRLGMGFDAFVVDGRVFIGGLLRPGTSTDQVVAALSLGHTTRLSTTALRTATTLRPQLLH